MKGLSAEWELGFDETKVLNPEQIAAQKRTMNADIDFKGTSAVSSCVSPKDLQSRGKVPASLEPVSACGAPNDLHYDEDAAGAITACGAPNHLQVKEEEEVATARPH